MSINFAAFSNQDIIAALQAQVATGDVLTDQDTLYKYSDDQYSVVDQVILPLAVIEAATIADVQAVLSVARQYHLAVITKATGTSVVSGSRGRSGAVILSLDRMIHILEVNPDDSVAVVEPGVINNDLDKAAREVGFFYAPDPGSKNISSIGGNVSTNAGGMSSVRYGVTKDNILGVKVVLADGRLVTLGGRTLKQAFGYDLTQLFVGSEGTLGVIVEITVKLSPIPVGTPLTGIAFFKDMADLAKGTGALRRSGVYPTMLEALDAATVAALDRFEGTHYADKHATMLIFKLDFSTPEILNISEQTLTANGAFDVQVTDDPEQAAALLKLRQDMLPAIFKDKNHVMEDMALPLSQMAGMMDYITSLGEKYGLELYVAGHAGDGNVHPSIVWDQNVTEPPAGAAEAISDMFKETIRRGGTISGEHAVGLQKNQWNNYELGETDYLQHQIKALLDPMGLLNPQVKIN